MPLMADLIMKLLATGMRLPMQLTEPACICFTQTCAGPSLMWHENQKSCAIISAVGQEAQT